MKWMFSNAEKPSHVRGCIGSTEEVSMRRVKSVGICVFAVLIIGAAVLPSGVHAANPVIVDDAVACSSALPPNCVDSYRLVCSNAATKCAAVDFVDTAGGDDDLRGVLVGLGPAGVGIVGQADTAVSYSGSPSSRATICRTSTTGLIRANFTIFVQSATSGSDYRARFFCLDGNGSPVGTPAVKQQQDE